MLRTIFFYLCFFPWTVLVVICGAPFSLISPDYMHGSARIWGRVSLWLAGVRLDVEGREHLPRAGQPVIFIGNHQGSFDILSYFVGLPTQFRWMAKEELFRVPLLGLAMRLSGYIPIDRSNSRKALKSVSAAAGQIRGGTSVAIFPEGTRSENGQLQKLKKGGFLIALKAQVPIVPVVINGSWKVMAKGDMKLHPGTIRLKILPQIETAGLTNRDLKVLIEQVSNCLAESLDEECHNVTVD